MMVDSTGCIIGSCNRRSRTQAELDAIHGGLRDLVGEVRSLPGSRADAGAGRAMVFGNSLHGLHLLAALAGDGAAPGSVRNLGSSTG